MENASLSSSNVENFIDFLYEGLEGYVYLAACDRSKAPDEKGYWKTEFFRYPEDKKNLAPVIQGASASLDVYLAPAIYSEPNPERESVKASNVVWTEFDGNAPDWSDDNIPSLIVQTSGKQNQHVYWRLNEPITDVDKLEDINRNITYNMGADNSAWDATQVLRPPDTPNWKRGGESVFVIEHNSLIFDISVFEALPAAPPQLETPEWSLETAPDIDTILLSYAFGPDLVRLLRAGKEEIKDRSASLMNLAYGCAQIGLSNNEILALLIKADDRWEKFKGRKDRLKRLSHIILVARNKYPEESNSITSDMGPMVFGFQSLIDTDISIDWVIEPMLMEQGNMMFVGPSGIGKTQFTVQVLIHMCLGKDFLHYKVAKPLKVLFLSLEMGHGELKLILEQMRGGLTDAEAELLDTNLLIVPYGEPWALNTPVGQQQAVELIEAYQPDGFVVDSIGSAVRGNISADESVQPITEFNDAIRKKYNLFTWYIHHVRKADKNSKTGPTQDDVYGNQYLFNRATSSYLLTWGKKGDMKLENIKQRLAMKEKPYYIERTDNLNFRKTEHVVDEVLAHYDKKPEEKQKGPTGSNGIEL